MTKIVINTCCGGYSLSQKCVEWLVERDGVTISEYTYADDRANPLLVAAVEALGAEAGGSCAELKVVDIPDEVEWQIESYDGREWVAETHRTWE